MPADQTPDTIAVPDRLRQIPSPPKQVYYQGANLDTLLKRPVLAVVGSRAITPYGTRVTNTLVRELAERGVVIVSGLAYGVDAVAHRAAIEVGGKTIAVLPSPLHDITPAGHRHLAKQILDSGGGLLSEYDAVDAIYKTNFVARNRLVAGLSQAILITEAVEKSGSLHTVRFALEQGKDVLVIPGNITSSNSVGSNNLLKSGALAVTSSDDVMHALGLTPHHQSIRHLRGRTPDEQVLIDLLLQGITKGDELLKASQLDVTAYNHALTMLELASKIRSLGMDQWALS